MEPPPPTIRDRPDIDELVNSLVGSGTSSLQPSRPESAMSSSGLSDNDGSLFPKGESFAQGNFSVMMLPPILDIKPPSVVERESVVMYSKEVQTSTWVPEEDSEEENEEEIRRRIEEEIRKEMELLRLEEERAKEEQSRLIELEKHVPGKNLEALLT